ncbi:MAG: dynamin family protein [Planctomycetes bacterium]|nr:dynamin family protein [Planctomycetota bacterium]
MTISKPLAVFDGGSDLKALLETLEWGSIAARFSSGVAAKAYKLRKRIASDVLIRLGGDSALVVVAIIGPNNSGKSTLFSKTTGTNFSPSSAEGGYTRRLTGVVSPRLYEELKRDESRRGAFFERFSVRFEDSDVADENALFLHPSEKIPENLVLIDTPDFDSVFQENRKLAESLIVTADLIFAVVTKHTYMNEMVRKFVSEAISFDRSYAVLYNEATDRETARKHVFDMTRNFGSPAIIGYYSLHDRGVSSNLDAFRPARIDDDSALDMNVFSGALAREILLKSRSASLKALSKELADFEAALDVEFKGRSDFVAEVRRQAHEIGKTATNSVFPIGMLEKGFVDALDKVSEAHRVMRWFPKIIGKVGKTIKTGYDKFLSTKPRVQEEFPTIMHLEMNAMEKEYPGFLERVKSLAIKFRAATRANSGGTHDEDEGEFSKLLALDLAPERMDGFRGRLGHRMAELEHSTAEFRTWCATRCADVLKDHKNISWLQVKATGMTLAPIAAAIPIVVLTGGVGADIAVLSAAAALSPLSQKLVNVLGDKVLDEAHETWKRNRSAAIAEIIANELIPASLAMQQDDSKMLARLHSCIDGARKHL